MTESEKFIKELYESDPLKVDEVIDQWLLKVGIASAKFDRETFTMKITRVEDKPSSTH